MGGDNDTTRRSLLKAVGGAAAATTVAGAASAQETTTEGGQGEFPVTVTQGQMPTTLDPQNHRSTPTDNVVLHAYEGLLSRTRKGKPQAQLATEWTRRKDGVVRFTIRKGVTFHSGNELTPEDVAFSINRIVKKDVGIASPQADQLAGVTGAKAVDGERAVDVMSDGLNPIVFALFATYGDIMEKEWVQNHSKSEIAKNMNGTGPFELETYEENVKVEFSRFEDYWQDPAAVSKLTFRAAKESSTRVNQLLEGESDVVVNVPPQAIGRVKNAKAARISAVPSTRIIYNAMRYDVEPFSSPKFRRAMNYAVDLESIVQNVLQSFGDQTGQPTLKGFFGYDPDVDPYPHNASKAEKLVEQSGHAGASLTLHTPVGRYLKDVEIAQAVANQIDQLSNVSCSVKQRDFATLAGELTDGKIETSPHFYLIGWGNATFDASQTIIPLLTTDGALTSYSSDKLDNLIKKAQNESDKQKRKQLLQQANTYAHDQAPWIFLNRQYSVYGVSSGVDWKARRDERIDAYAMGPAE